MKLFSQLYLQSLNSLFHLLYSGGFAAIVDPDHLPKIFHFQNSPGLCFLYSLYFHFQVLNHFLHLLVFSLAFLVTFKGFFYLLFKDL